MLGLFTADILGMDSLFWDSPMDMCHGILRLCPSTRFHLTAGRFRWNRLGHDCRYGGDGSTADSVVHSLNV